MTTAPPAKRQRQEEKDHITIEMLSTADEEEDDERDDDRDTDTDLFGLETETEEEDKEEIPNNAEVEMDHYSDDDNSEWVGSENEHDDIDDEVDEDEHRYVTRTPVVDIIGKLCCSEHRSPGQTQVVRERLHKSIQFLDALLCKPLPGKVCSRNCQKLREQWCQNVGVCRGELCQLWHEAYIHVKGCKNKKMCEYSIQIMLRETLHQIEHQHELINDVRGELDERKKELTEANAFRLFNPPSKITLLSKQVKLLKRELKSEEEQLEFYQCAKKAATDNAKKAKIDTVADFADFQTHYVDNRFTVARSTADQAIVREEKNAQVGPASISLSKKDDLLPSLDDTIGKLCYAGQRSQQQTEMFKESLRKSIEFIDALLCKPPPGKVCIRNCKLIRKIDAQRTYRVILKCVEIGTTRKHTRTTA